MTTIDMSVNLGGISMTNPINTCSGTFGSGYQYSRFCDVSKLGAITTKGVSKDPWAGNPQPRMCETSSGVMNSIGLENPGTSAFIANESEYLRELAKTTAVIVNVCGHTNREYVEALDALEQLDFVSGFEINISCPNVDAGGIEAGRTPLGAGEVTRLCRERTNKPILMKLSPAATNIADVARACQDAGADGVSLINTIPAMSINTRTRRSNISKPTAGLSGPAIHPIAVRMVWDVCKAVTIPVCAMGGISCVEDAAEFILVGATAVSVGTNNFRDPAFSANLVDELAQWVQSQGCCNISQLRGAFEC